MAYIQRKKLLLTCLLLQDNAKTMKINLDAQIKATDQLKGNARMLENKLADAKSKKDTLKARAKSADSSKQINEMLAGLNTGSATAAFDRMEEKVMALESESEAAMQVKHNFSIQPSSCANGSPCFWNCTYILIEQQWPPTQCIACCGLHCHGSVSIIGSAAGPCSLLYADLARAVVLFSGGSSEYIVT